MYILPPLYYAVNNFLPYKYGKKYLFALTALFLSCIINLRFIMFFERNICQFIPISKANDSLHPLNFVLELKSPTVKDEELSVFRLHFVLEGSAILKNRHGEFALEQNDVFICAPSKKYSLLPIKDFKYAYVSFFGIRASALTDKYNVNELNCVFKNMSELKNLWSNALPVPEEMTALRAESVILYTFSAIGARKCEMDLSSMQQSAASEARKHIDSHFSDTDLSLVSTCQYLSYSPKYLSTAFSKKYGTTFSKYLCSVRLEHARSLLDRGHTSIKTVAFTCGFTDPLYFSKVFKSKTGLSPREYVKKIGQKN